MNALEKSVVESLDGSDPDLFPFLPYILQDLWELGADPSVMLSLIKNNIKKDGLRVLDLGCGKGAVSINIAREIGCTVKGIDAMPDFIESAKSYAKQYKVQDKCDFETGDIRLKIKELKGFNVIILGAIGPVLGDLYTTLKTLSPSLNPSGYVLLDDGYIPDVSQTDYNRCLHEKEFYDQIARAGFVIVREIIFEREAIDESDKIIYEAIKKRIDELKSEFPGESGLFDEYIKSQEYENYILANELVTGTWLLQLKSC